MNLAKYRKSAALVAVTVAALIASIWTDGITPAEWALVAGTGAAAIGTHIAPNLPAGIGGWAKTAVTFVTTGATALGLALGDGLTRPELLEVLLAAAASIGLVASVRNVGDYRAVQRASIKAAQAAAAAAASSERWADGQ